MLLVCYLCCTFENILGMETVANDTSLSFIRVRVQLTGHKSSYAGDTLDCGDSFLSKLAQNAQKRFEVKSREHNNIRFSDAHIDRHEMVSICTNVNILINSRNSPQMKTLYYSVSIGQKFLVYS